MRCRCNVIVFDCDVLRLAHSLVGDPDHLNFFYKSWVFFKFSKHFSQYNFEARHNCARFKIVDQFSLKIFLLKMYPIIPLYCTL